MFRKTILTLATTGAAAATLALTSAASASMIIGDPPTPEMAGVQLTGAQFAGIHQTFYIRQAAQYAGSVSGYGHSIVLWGGGKVYVFGLSNTTTPGPFSPAVAVFDATTHALICATANSTCPDVPASWTSGTANIPAGHTARESGFYSKNAGAIHFTLADNTTGTSTTFSYQVAAPGVKVSFTQARAGTEFGSDPWSAPASFTHPATTTKVASYTSVGWVNYLGRNHPLTAGGQYWHTALLSMTGTGSVTEASAALTSPSSFTTSLQP
jgi:hypothetical protein